MTLRYGSVCSGIEAASVAWAPLGWTPAFFAEIERFPSEVLAHHYGSNLPGEPLSRNAPPNLGDITRFQEWPDAALDLLVGGTPCQSFSVAGLRAGLADPRGNLALTYLGIADRFRPRWVVWENVPGVLSSNGGRDFGAFLGGLAELGYGWAYRVLDAQYVRVDGFGRAVPQRRRRVISVGHLGDFRRAGSVLFEPEGLSGHPAPRREAREGAASTLARSVALRGRDGGGTAELGGFVGDTLRASGGGGDKAHVLIPVGDLNGASKALNATSTASGYMDVSAETFVAVRDVAHRWAVRRLTPLECERLQGFPDGYTDILRTNGKRAADGPRYMTLGNAMAVNVMRWIGRRIEMVEAISIDLAQDEAAA